MLPYLYTAGHLFLNQTTEQDFTDFSLFIPQLFFFLIACVGLTSESRGCNASLGLFLRENSGGCLKCLMVWTNGYRRAFKMLLLNIMAVVYSSL